MTNGIPAESWSFDETVLAVVAVFGGLFVVTRTVGTMWAAMRFRCGETIGATFAGAQAAGGLIILGALAGGAAREVRESPGYVAMLLGVGMVWMSLVSGLLAVTGVNLRVHGVERNNFAAVPAWSGAVLGGALCYAGGSIGEGPAMWENIFCAGVATLAMMAAWLILEIGAGISASITIERDMASGLRGGGFLMAAGMIAGRAVAGDWESVDGTLADFAHDAWVLLPLALVAVVVERTLRPSRANPRGKVILQGLVPGLGCVAVAAMWIFKLGKWTWHL